MAKKRKEKTDEEEIDFKLPKFDEEKFLKKERRNIKTLFLSSLLGFIIALISFSFWTLLSGSELRWELVLLLGVFNASWLKYLFTRLNIDLTDFGRKGWFGSYAIYFFTWLVVLIILVNPPFYDDETPHVETAILPGMQEIGRTVVIAAHIIDNVGIEKSGIEFTLTDPNGTTYTPEFTFVNSIFRYIYENSDNLLGECAFTLKVTDVNGLITETNGVFEYSNDALSITSSRFDDIRSGDAIVIKADEKISNENFRVYYCINNGSEINVDREDEGDKEEYETSTEFEGWSENSNMTVKIYAEAIHYFKNVIEKFSNIVEDTPSYNFSTETDSNIGSEPVLLTYNCTLASLQQDQKEGTINYELPCPIKVGTTPGFEVAIFLISLFIVALIFKYRKKDKKK